MLSIGPIVTETEKVNMYLLRGIALTGVDRKHYLPENDAQVEHGLGIHFGCYVNGILKGCISICRAPDVKKLPRDIFTLIPVSIHYEWILYATSIHPTEQNKGYGALLIATALSYFIQHADTQSLLWASIRIEPNNTVKLYQHYAGFQSLNPISKPIVFIHPYSKLQNVIMGIEYSKLNLEAVYAKTESKLSGASINIQKCLADLKVENKMKDSAVNFRSKL